MKVRLSPAPMRMRDSALTLLICMAFWCLFLYSGSTCYEFLKETRWLLNEPQQEKMARIAYAEKYGSDQTARSQSDQGRPCPLTETLCTYQRMVNDVMRHADAQNDLNMCISPIVEKNFFTCCVLHTPGCETCLSTYVQC